MYSTTRVQLLQWLHGKQQQHDASEWEDLGSDLSLGDNDGREVNSGSGGKFEDKFWIRVFRVLLESRKKRFSSPFAKRGGKGRTIKDKELF